MLHNQLSHWKSGELVIARSSHHIGMYIVNFPDGKFFNLLSTEETMLARYPKNKEVKAPIKKYQNRMLNGKNSRS